jgi:hypothetical protein
MTFTEIVIIVVFVALAGLGVYWWMMPSDHEVVAKQFQPHIAGYVDLMGQVDESLGPGSFARDKPLRLPMIAVDVDGRTVDPLHSQMPEAWRATDPAGVATVLLVKCETDHVGDYGFEDAYAHECRLWAIDTETREVVWAEWARRSPPRRVSFNIPFMDIIADRPEREMLEQLGAAVGTK